MGVRKGAFIVAVGLTGAAGLASASFDLMLIGGSDGRLHRYDPVNQVALGSFNTGSNNTYVAADSSGNAFYASPGSSAIRQVRYGTGELVQMLDGITSAKSLDVYGNHTYMLSGTTLRRTQYQNGTGATNLNLTAGIAWKTAGISGTTLTAIGTDASNVIVAQTVNLTSFTAGSLLSTGIDAQAGSTLGKASAALNPANNVRMLGFTYITTNGSLAFGRLSLGSTGAPISSALTSSAASGFATTYMPSVTAGHSGWFIYGEDSGSSALARITRFDLFTGPINAYSYTLAAPGGGVPGSASFGYHVTNVVAPEPGTMIAVGIGVVGLLRRRRRA